MTHKPVLVSGIQPTGKLHLGNYLGALKNFVDLQNSGKYRCYFFIADLHSLTEDFNLKQKPTQIIDLAADYLAAGIGKNSVIFQQSEIPAHTELTWILNTLTPMGELFRMTQLKDKMRLSDVKKIIAKNMTDAEAAVIRQEVEELQMDLSNIGLFDYPVLMAADIILYNASVVPVGEDQLQHLELARTLVRKFNNKFGKTFLEPKALMTKTPRVMSLDDPSKKMSKSRPAGCLFMDDSPAAIREKIMRATTDSGKEVKYDEKNKLGVSNLLLIYSELSGKSVNVIEKIYAGKGYAEFKKDLAEVVMEALRPFQERKKKLKPVEIKKALVAGNKKANTIASRKIAEVKKKIGLTI